MKPIVSLAALIFNFSGFYENDVTVTEWPGRNGSDGPDSASGEAT
jgi:predicted nucleic acid-binding Zn ribbon protein